jgi:hypothetical protein
MKIRFPGVLSVALVLCVPVSAWGRGKLDPEPNQQVEQIKQVQQAQPGPPDVNQVAPALRNRLDPLRRGLPPGGAQSNRGLRVHAPYQPPMTAEKIQIAIDDAITFLRSQQTASGAIGQTGGPRGVGGTAVAALAMLAAGSDPASDAGLRKALDWLAKQDIDHTYCRGISANTWEYALRKAPYSKAYRAELKQDFDWLMKAAANNPRGVWRYRQQSRDFDNSCSQYGVLGIWAAERAGFKAGDEFWKKVSKHFLSCQGQDGGWSYTTGGSTPNMVTAGLASVFLVFDMYHGKSCYTHENPRAFTEGDAAKVLASIDRGIAWLNKNGTRGRGGYYLYGIERTGVAGGRKYFGKYDWFKTGAETTLKAQQPNGAIHLGHWGNTVVQTSWSVLFLVYGGAPVAFNKLDTGNGADWNLNPRDLANLSKFLWSAYERPLNWQTVSIDDPVSEFEAPILFISGSKALTLSEKQILKLREYIQRGGTILAEPSDHSPAFEKSIHALVEQMFPENVYGERPLRSLPPEHGVYTVMKQTWEKRPRLLGVDDGGRTVVFLSKEYVSGDWQRNKTESDAFKLAMNLLFYATDLATLDGRFASILPEAPPAKERDTKAVVARVRHGTGRDWAVGARCWKAFAPYAKHITGCTLEDKVVELGKDDLAAVRILHLTGRGPLKLSAKERDALKQFVAGGGTVLADAYAGSPTFAASARKELASLFGGLNPLDAATVLATGRFSGGADLSRKVRFKLPARQRLRAQGQPTRGQQLEIATVDGRPAVVFSAYDLTGAIAGIRDYRAAGYKPDSARRIVGNMVAYVMVD